ncbi:INCE protein, partial [Cochlearius cochlearius]|nr:INCE protein [Cochlearius cochlearius]
EKERQRLESLRRKQEAEEQRKKKVEEEKRRRQAEMKQKREERLRKALQARERVEQMEEEKKKRVEQKILQNDEKVRLSQVREEKMAEERSKKKPWKKNGEADAWKQKALRGPPIFPHLTCRVTRVFFFLLQEDEFEQQEPLQKRREDEVKEKGKKVLERKDLVDQQQEEQVTFVALLVFERGMEMSANDASALEGQQSAPVLDHLPFTVRFLAQHVALGTRLNSWLVLSVRVPCRCPNTSLPCARLEGLLPALISTASVLQKSASTSYLGLPKGTKKSRSPKVNENNYGMDLNSDDSTDDENEPRKPVPAWADGSQLNQAVLHQYYHPVNVDQLFGLILSPKLEDIFGKSKPRYFKRTSSAVWHSPP